LVEWIFAFETQRIVSRMKIDNVVDDIVGQCALSRARHKAHARRKLHDLYANHRGEIAEEGLRYFAIVDVADQNAKGSGKEPVLRASPESSLSESTVHTGRKMVKNSG
jgi:hypothetical protein